GGLRAGGEGGDPPARQGRRRQARRRGVGQNPRPQGPGRQGDGEALRQGRRRQARRGGVRRGAEGPAEAVSRSFLPSPLGGEGLGGEEGFVCLISPPSRGSSACRIRPLLAFARAFTFRPFTLRNRS